MTDKELAEEYEENAECVEINDYGQKVYGSIEIEDAFLAGLKAGKPKWHNLREDPNDLPENKRNVWCDYGDGSGKGCYNKDDGGWWIEGHMFCSAIDAWYELPQFTDKEEK